ncbi:MAG: hypothetical protein ACJ8HI_19555 [Massilia sp.]
MNIAPTDISAAARSGRTGKHGRMFGAVLVRVLVASAVLAGACASVPAAAMGDRDQRDRGDQRDQRDHNDGRADQRERPHPQQQPQQQPQPREQQREQPQQRADARFDTRAYDMRLDEARRQQAQQQQDTGGRRGGRLTPDERRELRRQINEAGMDLYPNTPRR